MVAALKKLREAKDLRKAAVDLTEAYPDTPELDFMTPEPLADIEAHLRASKQFLPLKADAALWKLGENLALTARPLAEALSYVADANGGRIESTVVAERLSDIAKGLVMGIRLIETARIDLVCAAFKVPTSTAKPERGVSLMGSSFAWTITIARLRQDKKVLVGDEASTSGAAARQPLRKHTIDSKTDRVRDAPRGSANTTEHQDGAISRQDPPLQPGPTPGHAVAVPVLQLNKVMTFVR